MDQKNEPVLDLLGEPWTEQRDPRGRKRHRRLPQVAENVAVLVAAGHTQEEIARRVGLSEPTLRKYYFRELDNGDALAEAVLDEVMWAKAKGGNVSAARYINERFAKGRAAKALRERAVREPRLGKKEEKQQAATGIARAGKFAPPAAPKLIQ